MAIVLALAAALFTPAAVAGSKSMNDRVIEALSGYEYVPGKEVWDQLGEGAKPVLMEIVKDAGRPKVLRARAILALRWFPDETVRQFLLDIVHAGGQDETFTRKALYSLAGAFGEEVLEEVGSFLDHENPDIREAAARALGRIICTRSLGMLRKKLKAEKNAMVKKVLVGEIKKLQRLLMKKK